MLMSLHYTMRCCFTKANIFKRLYCSSMWLWFLKMCSLIPKVLFAFFWYFHLWSFISKNINIGVYHWNNMVSSTTVYLYTGEVKDIVVIFQSNKFNLTNCGVMFLQLSEVKSMFSFIFITSSMLSFYVSKEEEEEK